MIDDPFSMMEYRLGDIGSVPRSFLSRTVTLNPESCYGRRWLTFYEVNS